MQLLKGITFFFSEMVCGARAYLLKIVLALSASYSITKPSA